MPAKLTNNIIKMFGYIFCVFCPKGPAALKDLDIQESVSFFRPHHDSSMLAAALEDFTIIVMDLDTQTVVRKFQGHTGQLTDATFSPDARWLVTAAMDCTICTWDVPSVQLIDCFKVCINLTLVVGKYGIQLLM
jgi:U3 small nucleolar RNA-associated protein 21